MVKVTDKGLGSLHVLFGGFARCGGVSSKSSNCVSAIRATDLADVEARANHTKVSSWGKKGRRACQVWARCSWDEGVGE